MNEEISKYQTIFTYNYEVNINTLVLIPPIQNGSQTILVLTGSNKNFNKILGTVYKRQKDGTKYDV